MDGSSRLGPLATADRVDERRGAHERRSAHERQAPCLAFFDVDDTIITSKSLLDFLDHLCEEPRLGEVGYFEDFRARLRRDLGGGIPRENLNRLYYWTVLRGQPVSAVAEAAVSWFQRAEQRPGFYNYAVLGELRRHQTAHHVVALVTGSFRELLQPLISRLTPPDPELIIAPLVIVDGHYTGELSGPPTIGAEKAVRLVEMVQRHGADLTDCYAYGDDVSDIPMLELVGHPHMVNPRGGAADVCAERQWRSIS